MSAAEELVIRPFSTDDVPRWARTELERSHLLDALATTGDYLAAVVPDGRVVGKLGIRYDEQTDAGTVIQFDVVPEHRNRGIGTRLLARAEQLIRDRGLRRATLAVEEDNAAALRLYRRLGYREFGREPAEWDQQYPDGTVYRYHCVCLLLQRRL